jgi:hypothetical protein
VSLVRPQTAHAARARVDRPCGSHLSGEAVDLLPRLDAGSLSSAVIADGPAVLGEQSEEAISTRIRMHRGSKTAHADKVGQRVAVR